MSRLSSRTILGYLAAVFVVGLTMGGVAGYLLGGKSQPHFPTPEEFEAGWLAKYREKLSLTEAQVREVQPLLPEAVERLRTIWFQAIMTMGAVHESIDRQVEPFLDDPQRERLVEWIQHGRERRLRLARGRLDEQIRADSDLWAAAKSGRTEAISRHLAAGANVNQPDLGYGLTPLSLAAIYDQTTAAELLVQKGADVNARDRDGNTALHAAAFFGRVEVVQLLLRHGADVTVMNDHGETPLKSLEADWKLTQFIGDILQVELDQKRILAGRKTVAELLRAAGAEGAPVPSGSRKAGEARKPVKQSDGA